MIVFAARRGRTNLSVAVALLAVLATVVAGVVYYLRHRTDRVRERRVTSTGVRRSRPAEHPSAPLTTPPTT